MCLGDLLSQVRSACADVNLIGSGGVRNGVDIAKCIRLGAQMSALAQPFLAPKINMPRNGPIVIADFKLTPKSKTVEFGS